LAAQTSLEAASAENYVLVQALYKGGIYPYLNALIAQRTLYSARLSLASTRLVRAVNLVTLYRSLGGEEASLPTPVPRGAS
jgi:multidrug efflux system outer membrane protein